MAAEKRNVYRYNKEGLTPFLGAVLRKYTTSGQWDWATEQINKPQPQLTTAFVVATTKIGKETVQLSEEEHVALQALRSGLTIQNWTCSHLFRVWLLLHIDVTDKQRYTQLIERLFRVADLNELVALYSALPLLAYPDSWRMRCAEGVRSNMGDVLRAVICNNPYPSEELQESAWNQLVLKAFFVDLPVEQIIGIHERANARLAETLADYVAERKSAGRDVHPKIYELMSGFVEEK